MDRRRFRYWTVIVFLGLGAMVLLGHYAMLASQKDKAAAAAVRRTLAERGTISDRSGRLLALDSPLYNVAVWRPETNKNVFPSEAVKLASILETDQTEILERWSRGESDFFYIKKRVQSQTARSIQQAKAQGDFAGVVIEKIAGRLYPEKRLASHLLGFVGDGNSGLAGVESSFDKLLAPSGDADRGADLTLTIEANLQYRLEEVARRALASTGAESIVLLASDVRTGEIVAYVSMPDFDPNDYLSSPPENWYDRPSLYAYEPGSVFKVFSMASILDLGGVDENTVFVCSGAYRQSVPSGEDIVIRCLGSHGAVGIRGILEYSCNAGAGYAADRVQPLDFYDRLCAFGFGSRSGIGLSGESAGQLRSPQSWSLRSKPTIAMGQELLVTALQMTQAAAAIGNGGVLMKPIAVRRALSASGEPVLDNAPQVVRRVVSAATAREILDAMEAAAGEAGTGRRAKIDDIRMAVKTGTAQMIDPRTRRYSSKDFIASTLAIFPADAPTMALYLAIIKPKGESYYGGRIAAPVIKEAAQALLSVSDLPRGDTPSIQHPGTIVLPRAEAIGIGETMPDLRGVPKRLLAPLLMRKDISVRIKGEGYLTGQSPAPGSPVPKGCEIVLEFE